jgi:hypothetical protein
VIETTPESTKQKQQNLKESEVLLGRLQGLMVDWEANKRLTEKEIPEIKKHAAELQKQSSEMEEAVNKVSN